MGRRAWPFSVLDGVAMPRVSLVSAAPVTGGERFAPSAAAVTPEMRARILSGRLWFGVTYSYPAQIPLSGRSLAVKKQLLGTAFGAIGAPMRCPTNDLWIIHLWGSLCNVLSYGCDLLRLVFSAKPLVAFLGSVAP